jgi:hypothetical protein
MMSQSAQDAVAAVAVPTFWSRSRAKWGKCLMVAERHAYDTEPGVWESFGQSIKPQLAFA